MVPFNTLLNLEHFPRLLVLSELACYESQLKMRCRIALKVTHVLLATLHKVPHINSPLIHHLHHHSLSQHSPSFFLNFSNQAALLGALRLSSFIALALQAWLVCRPRHLLRQYMLTQPPDNTRIGRILTIVKSAPSAKKTLPTSSRNSHRETWSATAAVLFSAPGLLIQYLSREFSPIATGRAT